MKKTFNMIEAVYKATPSKPFINGPGCWTCRKCGEYVIPEYNQPGLARALKMNYCPNCGEALDWPK